MTMHGREAPTVTTFEKMVVGIAVNVEGLPARANASGSNNRYATPNAHRVDEFLITQ